LLVTGKTCKKGPSKWRENSSSEKNAGHRDAVKSVRPLLKKYDGDVLIICGDTPLLTKQTLEEIIKQHLAGQMM